MSSLQTNPDLMHVTGDVLVDSISCNTASGAQFDLYPYIEQIDIYEDVYSNAITGSVTIVDSMNLIGNVPIVGTETLSIGFKTAGAQTKVNLLVSIYSISERVPLSDKSVMYKLNFTSPEFMVNLKTRFSVGLSGTPSELVAFIFSKYLTVSGGSQLKKIEKTNATQNIVVPYWTPLETINWLASRTNSGVNQNSSAFVFYQTIRNGYAFVSLSTLMDSPSVITYTGYPKGYRKPQNVVGERDIVKEFTNAIDIKIDKMHDRLNQLSDGMFASQVGIYDPTFKTYRVSKFSYANSFIKTPHLDQNPSISFYNDTFSSNPNVRRHSVVNPTYLYTGVLASHKPENYLGQTESTLISLRDIVITLTVPGDSRRQPGDVVRFECPAAAAVSSSGDGLDAHLTGNYLMTAIHHMVRKDKYEMQIELSKESLTNPIADKKTIV